MLPFFFNPTPSHGEDGDERNKCLFLYTSLVSWKLMNEELCMILSATYINYGRE